MLSVYSTVLRTECSVNKRLQNTFEEYFNENTTASNFRFMVLKIKRVVS